MAPSLDWPSYVGFGQGLVCVATAVALLTGRVGYGIVVVSVVTGRGNASDTSVQAIRLFMRA